MSIFFLNGCTSAGKSSIVAHLQQRLPEPHLRLGIDDAFNMLPPHLHNHQDGFFFDQDDDGNVRLNFGDFGLSTLKAHHRAAAAIARSGVNLILDEVILTRALRDDWLETLKDIEVFMVGVHCDLDALERREIERGDRIHGQARGQFNIVHRDMIYDLAIDTTHIDPPDAAESIIEATASGCAGTALSRMLKFGG